MEFDDNDIDGAKVNLQSTELGATLEGEQLIHRQEDLDTTPQLISSKSKKSNNNNNIYNRGDENDGIELGSVPDESSKSNNSIKKSLEKSIKSIKIDDKNIALDDDKVYKEVDTSTPLSESNESSINNTNSNNNINNIDDIDETNKNSNKNVLVDSNNNYDRNLYFEYRDSHRDPDSKDVESPTIVTGIEHKPKDINDAYDQMKEREALKNKSKFKYFQFIFNKNKYRWDPNQNRRFKLSAQIITRFGFFSKTLLYASLGIISITAAIDKTRSIAGPDGVFEELEEIFSSGLIVVLVLGLWSYGCWGIFYVLFDIDDLGHGSAGAILKRFGRVFSSGFYFVLGVDAIRVLIHQKKKQSGTQQIMSLLYSHVVGKIIICILGVTFFVVCIVYLFYAIKPGKFKRELATERMNKYLYWTALGFARLGALGRSMFFGAFGAVLIIAVADIDKGLEGDTTLLGFQGVFQQIANYSATLLFIIAVLIVFYAFWCLWLLFFRRLPAHKDEAVARQLLGSKLDPNLRFHGVIFAFPKNQPIFKNGLF